jgi:hypothetical protein
MEERNVHPQRRRPQIWWSTGVMLATTLGAAIITRQGPTTLENAMASAALVAAGTLGVAAIGARTTRYPSWSYWTGAGIMAAAALIGPITASAVVATVDDINRFSVPLRDSDDSVIGLELLALSGGSAGNQFLDFAVTVF